MDPGLDPPPLAAHPTVVIPACSTANPTSVQTAGHNHPPYAEMITGAIAALKERDGSSKRAIAKYIETQYSDLPPTHSDLLAHNLKSLKTNGQLLMVKHSYQLPGARSAPSSVNGSVNVESADPVSAVLKRRRGRPSKPKPDAVQAAVPVFPPHININDVPVFPPETLPGENVSVWPDNAYNTVGGPANGAAADVPVRGRGRPPKQGGIKRGPGRPPRSGGVGVSGGGRSRGRPRKTAFSINAIAERGKGSGRPRGRPPNPINVVEGFAPEANLGGGAAEAPAGFAAPPVVAPIAGKRRGRPPKAGNEAKRPRSMNSAIPKPLRKLSGKPLGRPRKNSQAMGNRTQGSQLLVAYLDLKANLENLQSMVKQTAAFVRPFLNSEAAINAVLELELASDTLNIQQQPLAEPFQPRS